MPSRVAQRPTQPPVQQVLGLCQSRIGQSTVLKPTSSSQHQVVNGLKMYLLLPSLLVQAYHEKTSNLVLHLQLLSPFYLILCGIYFHKHMSITNMTSYQANMHSFSSSYCHHYITQLNSVALMYSISYTVVC